MRNLLRNILLISDKTYHLLISSKIRFEKIENQKYMSNTIFDFNHISPDLTIEQELELKGCYESCHLKCFLSKKAFQHYKKIKYGCRFVRILLTAVGIASVIASGGVLGILADIPGIVIETIMDYKNVNNNIISCQYAFQSYQHLMIQIKTALRLGRYDREHLVNCINNVDNYIIDTCPVVDKFKKEYERKFNLPY